jgi:hypothetical protein
MLRLPGFPSTACYSTPAGLPTLSGLRRNLSTSVRLDSVESQQGSWGFFISYEKFNFGTTKQHVMTTVIINEKTKAGKSLIEYLRHSNHATIIEDKQPNAQTLKAIKDIEEGKVTSYKSAKDLMSSLKQKAGV